MINEFRISTSLPESTLQKDSQRHPEAMSAEELRICLAGEITFTSADERTLLAFHDVPVLGFAADLVDAARQVVSGKPEASFLDFYGEFEVHLLRDGEEVHFTNTFSGESFTARVDHLRRAIKEWAPSLVGAVENAFPQITRNPRYPSLREEVLRL
jgi:hypothetical protein